MPPFSTLFKYKVRTLDSQRLSCASADLAAIVSEFKPDLLIGIRSGGYVVAQVMAAYFPAATLLPITCRRPSTEKKQKATLLKNLLRILPASLTAILRIIEHVLLTQARPQKQGEFIALQEELTAIEHQLQHCKTAPNILIIDDSVDSGATLSAVVNTVKNIAGPNAKIKTAVITVTTDAPFIQPNFKLYHHVLCRFPWSLDFKR